VTALVTGATGFIGRRLVAELAGAGHRVRALVHTTPPPDTFAPAGIDVVHADLSSRAPLDTVVRGCDVVFHLAAAHGAQAGAADCEAVNVRGTLALGEAAARAGVRRFVNASTRGVYGFVRGGTLDEHSPTAPDSPYRLSKLRAERDVAALHDRHGLPLVIVRLPSVIGPGGMGWLGLFRGIARGNFHLVGRGANRHHPCPLDDVVQALVLAGTVDHADGETFVVSGAADYSLREFLELIAEALDTRLSPVRIPAVPWSAWHGLRVAAERFRGQAPSHASYEFFFGSYRIDDAKARRLLGYRPAMSLDDAVRQAVVWYRQSGYL
jgi:nucleoside-diphosphate-sugar epimerase